MHGTRARRGETCRQTRRARNGSTHTCKQTKQVGGQGDGRTCGAQRMSSGPMLDARHAGQAGEGGRQSRRACAAAAHTHRQTNEAGGRTGRRAGRWAHLWCTAHELWTNAGCTARRPGGRDMQAEQAGVQQHTHVQHTKQAVNEGIERDAQHSGATCADSMHEDVIWMCG